jgi:hypothetical protein
MSMRRLLVSLVTAGAALAGPAWAGVEGTVHNLSISGPGEIKSTSEKEVCIFCHSTHVPNAQVPLWNRDIPNPSIYTVYKSSTMKSASKAPDGASKLCLSCHDGTVALGSVLSRGRKIDMRGVGARGEIPKGRRSHIGTDISGSHPVSIGYDDNAFRARNAAKDRTLGVETGLAPKNVVAKDLLDPQGKVQCTTCHDPHEDKFSAQGDVPHFWRRATVSEVCENCHTW